MPPSAPPEFSDSPTTTDLQDSPTTPGTPTTPTTVTRTLPRFLDRRPKLDALPEGATVEPPTSSPGSDAPASPEDGASASPARRTTSSAGSPKADPRVVAAMLSALIGAAATLAAALLLRSPRPRELREPTEEQREAIAAPLGRIAGRHLPASLLVPDLMDGIAAAAGVSAYVAEGPLTYPAHTPGAMPDPDDVQEQ